MLGSYFCGQRVLLSTSYRNFNLSWPHVFIASALMFGWTIQPIQWFEAILWGSPAKLRHSDFHWHFDSALWYPSLYIQMVSIQEQLLTKGGFLLKPYPWLSHNLHGIHIFSVHHRTPLSKNSTILTWYTLSCNYNVLQSQHMLFIEYVLL